MTAPEPGTIERDLLAELRRRLEAPGLAYSEPPERLEGGRETTICAFRLAGLTDAHPLAGPLILRLIPPHYDPERALWEGAVQNAAATAGYPAPRVPLAEAEPRIAGQAYLVMERLPGVPMSGTMVSDLDKNAALTLGARLGRGLTLLRGVARQLPVLARTLAEQQLRLHAVDPKPLFERIESGALPEPLVRVESWVEEMAAMVKEYRLDGLRAGLAWLSEERPSDAAVVIGHGDFGPHNLLVEEGRITGVIDWSYARLAEPEFDVGNSVALIRLAVGFLPGAARPPAALLAGRLVRRYLASYREQRPLDPERLHYHEALRTCRELCTLGRWRIRNRHEALAVNAWDPAGDHLENHFRKLTGVALHTPPR